MVRAGARGILAGTAASKRDGFCSGRRQHMGTEQRWRCQVDLHTQDALNFHFKAKEAEKERTVLAVGRWYPTCPWRKVDEQVHIRFDIVLSSRDRTEYLDARRSPFLAGIEDEFPLLGERLAGSVGSADRKEPMQGARQRLDQPGLVGTHP